MGTLAHRRGFRTGQVYIDLAQDCVLPKVSFLGRCLLRHTLQLGAEQAQRSATRRPHTEQRKPVPVKCRLNSVLRLRAPTDHGFREMFPVSPSETYRMDNLE